MLAILVSQNLCAVNIEKKKKKTCSQQVVEGLKKKVLDEVLEGICTGISVGGQTKVWSNFGKVWVRFGGCLGTV